VLGFASALPNLQNSVFFNSHSLEQAQRLKCRVWLSKLTLVRTKLIGSNIVAQVLSLNRLANKPLPHTIRQRRSLKIGMVFACQSFITKIFIAKILKTLRAHWYAALWETLVCTEWEVQEELKIDFPTLH
jgi:hypothetical protein